MRDDRCSRTASRGRFVVAIVVLGIATIAGCYLPAGPGMSIDFGGPINTTDDGIEVRGELYSDGMPDQDTYEDVRVVMYDEQGDVLHSERVGDLEADSGTLPINVSASEPPEYVTFESEDFWEESEIQVEYFYRTDHGEYWRDEATERSELPGHRASGDRPSNLRTCFGKDRSIDTLSRVDHFCQYR